MSQNLEHTGFLLHITHYDPVWVKTKDTEEPFDKTVAFAVIDAMAELVPASQRAL